VAELYSEATAAAGLGMAVTAAGEVEGWAGTLERKQEQGRWMSRLGRAAAGRDSGMAWRSRKTSSKQCWSMATRRPDQAG